MSANEIPKTIFHNDYPDPRSIPSPSYQQPIPLVTLSELIPGKYVSTTARIVYIKTVERQDALGSKTIFSGISEGSTFKVPFISHRISCGYFHLASSTKNMRMQPQVRRMNTRMFSQIYLQLRHPWVCIKGLPNKW
jgi:hypothetical protein